MPVKSAASQHKLFQDQEVYTPAEIGHRLKATTRQARRWIDEQKIDPKGVIELPRGRLVYGWALNEFIAGRVLGGA